MESWDTTLAPTVPWAKAYPAVVSAAKLALAGVRPDAPLTTNQLVERLYPVDQARGLTGATARQRIFAALRATASRDLATNVSRGPAKLNSYGTRTRPFLWSATGTGTGPGETTPKPATVEGTASLARRMASAEAKIETLGLQLERAIEDIAAMRKQRLSPPGVKPTL